MFRSLYIPITVRGHVKDIQIDSEIQYWFPWIEHIRNTDTYLHLNARWQKDGSFPNAPPRGHARYIISGDSLMFGWGEKLLQEIDGEIIQIFQSVIPQGLDQPRLKHMVYNLAHLKTKRLPTINLEKNIKYKFSALTNRISQSKIIIFAALKDLIQDEHLVCSLNSEYFQEKNVHSWQLTGNEICDHYLQKFQINWQGKTINLPFDDGDTHSYHNPAYTQSAINFTQESYHYSLMCSGTRSIIQPGPFLSEKTWKCLASETAFIPVGQYHSYRWLKGLGLRFEYGGIDLSFDDEPGNLDRLAKIIDIIKILDQYSAHDLFDMTRDDSIHNRQWIQSLEFQRRCELDNETFYNYIQS